MRTGERSEQRGAGRVKLLVRYALCSHLRIDVGALGEGPAPDRGLSLTDANYHPGCAWRSLIGALHHRLFVMAWRLHQRDALAASLGRLVSRAS